MKYLAIPLLALISGAASAFTQYDPVNKTLVIQQLATDGIVYNNVVVQVQGTVDIVSVGSSQPVMETKCRENFFNLQYAKIELGMSKTNLLDTIGCAYDAAQTKTAKDGSWQLLIFENSDEVLEMIRVFIDPATETVIKGPNGEFKSKSGF